jgi:hypothetical protein
MPEEIPEKQQIIEDENSQVEGALVEQQGSAETDTTSPQSTESTTAEKLKTVDASDCNCEFCEVCSFFIERLAVLPKLARQVREHYCFQHKQRCARYVLRQVTGKGDPNLLPSDMKTVADLLGWDL